MEQALRSRLKAFIVIADERFRAAALQLAHSLRATGRTVDYSFHPAKVGKQFQLAESLGAEYALVIGQEWPKVTVKNLANRTEEVISKDDLAARISQS
jgi:histidyl-tRNA synthetase